MGNNNRSEEEILAVLDGIISNISNRGGSEPETMNKKSEEQIKAACDVMRQIVKGKNVRVSYELNSPYNGMGFISIIGKKIDVVNPLLLSKIMEISSNMEVYPKTNGDIQMNFTFYNLT